MLIAPSLILFHSLDTQHILKQRPVALRIKLMFFFGSWIYFPKCAFQIYLNSLWILHTTTYIVTYVDSHSDGDFETEHIYYSSLASSYPNISTNFHSILSIPYIFSDYDSNQPPSRHQALINSSSYLPKSKHTQI